MAIEDRFYRTVVDALAHDRLVLPTLPEVALHVRDLAASDNVSIGRLAAEISKDAALAVRLVRVANSAAARGGRRVDNVQQAVTRLGLEYTRLLVNGLVVEQMFQGGSPALRGKLQDCWRRSVSVAALARLLAAHCTLLNPEMAMLAGLVHEIGVLPVLRLAAQQNETPGPALDAALHSLGPRIGRMVLQAWHFPPELVEVPAQWNDFDRRHDGPADFVDLVCVAALQSSGAEDARLAAVNRASVPAFARLDLNPERDVLEVEGYRAEFDEACAALAA